MKISGIYQITNTITNDAYVGQSQDIKKRWNEHKFLLNKGTHHSLYLQNAWNKYGEENFTFTVVYQIPAPLIGLLDTLEQFYLSSPNRSQYNIAREAGTPRGVKHTPETRKKMSEAGKRKVISPETKAKISSAKKGKKLPPRSAEHRAKLREAQKGKVHSPETRAKMSESQRGNTKGMGNNGRKGRVASPETRAKMSESQRGNTNARGTQHSQETREKMSEAAKRRHAREREERASA